MGTEFEHNYHIQFCGEQWFSAGMNDGVAVPVDEAAEVRLWDGDTVLAVVKFENPTVLYTRGTYTIESHNLGPSRELTKDEAIGWRDWRAALEYASNTTRRDWDKED